VGVFKGQTFTHLHFVEQDAVDPAFQFETSAHQAPGRRYFPLTSDEFFRKGQALPSYDLIFLDGLHTFEQTFRDFCASLAHAHPGTVWIIDDTVPSDLFSALRDMRISLKLRAEAGLKSRKWHGDVFKSLFAIHDFFPTFDFRTVVDDGNEQTIIARSPRADFEPRWNDLETISRLSYLDFQANRGLLNEVTTEQMFDWLTGLDLSAKR
jgi:hypothetical protein